MQSKIATGVFGDTGDSSSIANYLNKRRIFIASLTFKAALDTVVYKICFDFTLSDIRGGKSALSSSCAVYHKANASFVYRIMSNNI